MKRSHLALGILVTIMAVSQVLAAWLLYDSTDPAWRINLGWGVLWISAVFGWVPIFTLRSRGEVRGRSYIHTTHLVDSGIYGIVRHPQYLAGVLLSLALPLITWHWLVVLPGVINPGFYYLNTFQEEKQNLEKFGEAYREYQQKVPRMNFLPGLLRWMGRKIKK
jgi:protein-S-isoprenylcysteine O-methyltransferase Ste14